MFAANRYIRLILFANDDLIVQTDGVEDRFEGVIAVLAFSDHIQVEIDFRMGAQAYVLHDSC